MVSGAIDFRHRLRARVAERRQLAAVHRRMGALLGAAAHDAANLMPRPCPACGADDAEAEPTLRAPVYAFHLCRGCRMLYAPWVLRPEIVRQRYAGTPLMRAYRALLGAGADPGAYRQLARRLVAAAPARRVAIDVGCGFGALLAALAGEVDQAIGLELDGELAEAARRRFAVAVSTERLEDVARAPGSVDLVTMNQILEHVHQPRSLIAAARRLLAPSGVLWISVPHGASLGLALRGGRHPTVATHVHVNLFTAGTLRALVESAGLRVDDIASDDDPDLASTGAALFLPEKALRWGLARARLLSRIVRGAHLELWARRP